MNPFISYREELYSEIGYYILQKEFPHFLCKVSKFPEKVFVGATAISGYNLWLVFCGTLRGSSIPSYKNVDAEIVSIMERMAAWFYEERIILNPKRYKKWKIRDTSTV